MGVEHRTPGIILLSYGRAKGGVLSHVEELSRFLQKEGCLVQTIFLRDLSLAEKGRFVLSAMFNMAEARKKGILYKMTLARRAIGSINASGNLLVHSHDPFTTLGALELGRFPVLATVHGFASREFLMDYDHEGLARFARDIESRAYTGAKRLIAVSQDRKRILVEEFGIPPEKVTVVPNAVDQVALEKEAQTQETNPLVRALKEERLQGGRIVLFPRRLVENAGVHIAIEALPSLPENYRFWIVGDGPLRQTIRDKAKELKLGGKIRLLGERKRSTVLALMKHSWAVAVPSISVQGVIEGSPMVVLESMALGTPVVASNIGGLREVIRHGENGILFQAGDPNGLAEALMLLEDDRLRRRIAEEGKQWVKVVWNVDRWGQTILQEYARVLEEV